MDRVLRTRDDRFQNLPGYDFDPHYVEDLIGYEGLRCHYIDLGPKDAEQTYLCLHGQPTWLYLYRHMIPAFLESGARVVAPDFFGFGRSDKPADQSVYTFNFHRNMLLAFLSRFDLTELTLVCQDWGGILGLTLPMEAPHRFSRLLVMNTALGTGDAPLGDGFLAWRQWCRDNPDLSAGRLLSRACPHLQADEVAAYDAPFPTRGSKAGARIFPSLVPLGENEAVPDQLKAWEVLEKFDKPFTCAFSDKDPITRGGDAKFREKVPGARDNPLHRTLSGHHFIQEDDPEGFAAVILETAKRSGV